MDCIVRIGVSDSGTGMDEDTLRRATEPFFTTKDVGKGTGLGLSMVHGMATQSGGGFRLTSALGKGTTVDLWLPLSNQTVEAEHEHSGISQPAGAGVVLFVDDDALVMSGTVMALEDLGYSVVTADSGVKALEILGEGTKVDLIITDYAMPNMTCSKMRGGTGDWISPQ